MITVITKYFVLDLASKIFVSFIKYTVAWKFRKCNLADIIVYSKTKMFNMSFKMCFEMSFEEIFTDTVNFSTNLKF